MDFSKLSPSCRRGLLDAMSGYLGNELTSITEDCENFSVGAAGREMRAWRDAAHDLMNKVRMERMNDV
jgi:hypothetical protein